MAVAATCFRRILVTLPTLVFLISSVCDIIEPVPVSRNDHHWHEVRLVHHGKTADETEVCLAGKDHHHPPTGDDRPPLPRPSTGRHVRTRRWRTRVSRRLCSTDGELAESLAAGSRTECVDLCIDRGPGCRAANYIGGEMSICELYHCEPITFERDVDDCQYIQVVDVRERRPGNNKMSRTVIFIGGRSLPGQQVFLRGGVSETRRAGCSSDPETDQCAVDINVEELGDGAYYGRYDAWRHGNSRLSWHGAQADQGTYDEKLALGTPMVLTSNGQFMAGYQPDNVCGDRYWRVDMAMDCSQTDDGWFEVRGILANGDHEQDITQIDGPCNGTAGGHVPYAGSTNHLARCGYVNVFEWNSGSCSINHF